MPPYLPPRRIDPAFLPPPLLASEPGSFAYDTVTQRLPDILRRTIATNAVPAAAGALQDLHAEMTGGRLRGLLEMAEDRTFWDEVCAPHIGLPWLDCPWFFAETFFYRRILEATGYFQPGPGQGVDPFAATKSAEWAPDAAPAAIAALAARLPEATRDRFSTLFHASLWGNRIDLSLPVAAHLGTENVDREHLLVDDSDAVWRLLEQRPGAIAFIADNTGTELAMDLTLIDFLLSAGLVGRITLYLKPQPFFVSDAMPADIEIGLSALAAGSAAGRQLAASVRRHLAAGSLRLATHWFFPTSLFYFDLPGDLFIDLAGQTLVIIKGDLNYRRLCGDARWAPTTSFGQVTAYFPAPLVALRTFKAELVVGLAPGEAGRIQAEDPDWLVNGRRGVIQANLHPLRASGL